MFVSREAGVKFFRFNAGLAAILIAIAIAFHPASDSGIFSRAGLYALVIAEAAVVFYWATVGRTLAAIRPAITVTWCVAGFVSIVAQALTAAAGRPATDA